MAVALGRDGAYTTPQCTYRKDTFDDSVLQKMVKYCTF